ncbi:MAG: VOC family protein [Chloroflexi bacterium]|nr:VOC family protein [Chloroflexota bacterium]
MERATGIGGVFMRAADPDGLARWYSEHLGINPMSSDTQETWWQEAGPTVWSPFPLDTDYFGRAEQAWMINFRVRHLDAMRAQLDQAGVSVDDKTEVLDGIGRFGWAVDPEGNRIELWEPAQESLRGP